MIGMSRFTDDTSDANGLAQSNPSGIKTEFVSHNSCKLKNVAKFIIKLFTDFVCKYQK
jgi:hypothetical protein